MSFEVEQKFQVESLQILEQRLADLGVRFETPVEQSDVYFAHPARDFAQTDEALRIRQVGEDNFVTYKGPKQDLTTKTRREIELPIEPGLDGRTRFRELLEILGFKPVREVRKTRRKGVLLWQGWEVESALDWVIGLGNYLELEIVTDAAQVEEAKRVVAEVSKQLDLGPSERRSYLELLLQGESRPDNSFPPADS